MLQELLKIYEMGRVVGEGTRCLFPETLIFDEGWLLRAVLQAWRNRPPASGLPFLPFPPGAACYSEGQLRTPFKRRLGKDDRCESNSHVDGIVGDFRIDGTKSGVDLVPGLQYIAVFEAKMYSPLSRGTRHAAEYDQLSRLAACLISGILEAGPALDYCAHLVVIHPEDHPSISEADCCKDRIAGQIAARLASYQNGCPPDDSLVCFARDWQAVLSRLNIQNVTWEAVLTSIGGEEFDAFYAKCKKFSR